MDLIKLATRRSTLSEIVYIVLNFAYALALLVLVLLFDPPILAFLLVVLSKWRTLAVRPRYWFANVQANLISALVEASMVALLWIASGALIVQLVITALLAVWLTLIKPQSKRHWMLIQALICQFLSITALLSLAYGLIASVTVAGSWLIGYIVARHALSSYSEETDRTLLSLIWGVFMAELAWLFYHWSIAYSLTAAIMIPEMAIISCLLGFLAIKSYEASRSGKRHWVRELKWPIVFVLFLSLTLTLFFNGLDPNTL